MLKSFKIKIAGSITGLTGNVYFERSGPAPIKIFRVTFTLHLDFLSNLIGGFSKFSTN